MDLMWLRLSSILVEIMSIIGLSYPRLCNMCGWVMYYCDIEDSDTGEEEMLAVLTVWCEDLCHWTLYSLRQVWGLTGQCSQYLSITNSLSSTRDQHDTHLHPLTTLTNSPREVVRGSVLRDCDIVDADTVHPCQWGGCEAADWAQPAQLSLQLHITYPPLPPPTPHQQHHTPQHPPGQWPPPQYRYTPLQQWAGPGTRGTACPSRPFSSSQKVFNFQRIIISHVWCCHWVLSEKINITPLLCFSVYETWLISVINNAFALRERINCNFWIMEIFHLFFSIRSH